MRGRPTDGGGAGHQARRPRVVHLAREGHRGLARSAVRAGRSVAVSAAGGCCRTVAAQGLSVIGSAGGHPPFLPGIGRHDGPVRRYAVRAADAALADAPAFVPVPAPSPASGTAAWLDHLEGALRAHGGAGRCAWGGHRRGGWRACSTARFRRSGSRLRTDRCRAARGFCGRTRRRGAGFEWFRHPGMCRCMTGRSRSLRLRWPPFAIHWRSCTSGRCRSPRRSRRGAFARGARFGLDGLVRASGDDPVGVRRSCGDFVAIEAGDGVMRLPDLVALATRLGDLPSDTGEGDR